MKSGFIYTNTMSRIGGFVSILLLLVMLTGEAEVQQDSLSILSRVRVWNDSTQGVTLEKICDTTENLIFFFKFSSCGAGMFMWCNDWLVNSGILKDMQKRVRIVGIHDKPEELELFMKGFETPFQLYYTTDDRLVYAAIPLARRAPIGVVAQKGKWRGGVPLRCSSYEEAVELVKELLEFE